MAAPGVGIPMVAQGAITKYQAVMVGTAYPQVKVTTGANVAIIGFALNDADDGQEVAIVPVSSGQVTKAIAGASFSRGKPLMAEGSDGRVKEYAANATAQYGCGIALEDGADGQFVNILTAYWFGCSALS